MWIICGFLSKVIECVIQLKLQEKVSDYKKLLNKELLQTKKQPGFYVN